MYPLHRMAGVDINQLICYGSFSALCQGPGARSLSQMAAADSSDEPAATEGDWRNIYIKGTNGRGVIYSDGDEHEFVGKSEPDVPHDSANC